MKEKLKNKISRLLTFILTLCLTFIIFYAGVINALENDNSVLIKKVSKSFTNKFCNSIGFGLSKESAMNFSIKENNQVFNKRKGINDINKELLAEEIAISVIENCGYPINLSNEKGVMEFKSYYLSKEKEYLDTK